MDVLLRSKGQLDRELEFGDAVLDEPRQTTSCTRRDFLSMGRWCVLQEDTPSANELEKTAFVRVFAFSAV